MKKQVLWDWNGTLLNDLTYCMEVRNRVMPRLGFRGVSTLEQYREEFTFPIREYYLRAGVGAADFNRVAHEWMAEYERGFPAVPLYPDVTGVLQTLKDAGLRQVILSATMLEMLEYQVSSFPIRPYFDTLLGLGDIYAKSKEEIGRQYLQSCGIAPEDSLMIGDTLHDAEVAAAMGTDCVLVCRGHHSRERLLTAGVPVVDSLTEAVALALQ